MATCQICTHLAQRGRAGDDQFIAELSESFVVLADDQAYPGYCILVLKDHHEQLAALPLARQVRLWGDVARVAAAIAAELTPARINYECLGNFVPHVHWHVIPRYADDPRREDPIWVRPAEERRGELTTARRAELVGRLRRALDQRRPG